MSVFTPLKYFLFICVSVLAIGPAAHSAQLDPELVMQEIQTMKQRIQELEEQLQEANAAMKEARQAREDAESAKLEAEEVRKEIAEVKQVIGSASDGIKVGGAVRVQYSNERYQEGNRDRGGDFDFDVFRLNLDGSIGDVMLSAEWRWFQYMNAIHHAWIGYEFTEASQAQIGIHQVPFGVLPYNSHNFFFSSNYYVGLEDDYDAGIKYLYNKGPWDLSLGFYFNDEQGGVDGYVDNREDRYSYDVLGARAPGEGIYAAPANELAENNTWNARVAYDFKFSDSFNIELGLSGQYGRLHDGNDSAGHHDAYAVHLVGNYGRWNLQLQAASYEYDVNGGGDLMSVGAYSFYDTIPAKANTYTANLAYSMPVSWGPISNLTFYNDYSLVSNKSGNLDDTWMNVLGVSVSAGGLYTYIDFVTAENQPFIGGSMGSNSGKTEHRFNINLGYYF